MSIELAKEISKESKSSFYYAFNLLPPPQREAMNAVYAFCRKTDDIVDDEGDNVERKYQILNKWRIELEKALDGNSDFNLLNTVGKTIKQFDIPTEYFFDLIKGMETDLIKSRYYTFEELKLYCYRVASTVGLICIEIFGYKHDSAKEFAKDLGIALQLTNILRDIKKDYKINRIYIPQEDLSRFNYFEDDLKNNVYNQNFIDLMNFQATRAECYFSKSTKFLNIEDKSTMFAARSMHHIYKRVLDKLKENNFDIFSHDIKVSKFEKIGITLGVFLKYHLVYK